jgi:hypothetical protein
MKPEVSEECVAPQSSACHLLLLVFYSDYSSTLKVEATRSFESLVLSKLHDVASQKTLISIHKLFNICLKNYGVILCCIKGIQ